MAGSDGRCSQAATVTFGTTGFTALMHFVGGLEESRPRVEVSDLAQAVNTKRKFIPGDLIAHEPITLRYEFNPSMSTQPPITGASETVTVTFPLRSGQSVNATLAGTAFVTKRKTADLEVNDENPMMGELELSFSGATGPTLTAGS